MKKPILLFIGLCPFFLGGFLSFLVTLYADYLFPYKLIGFLFLVFWAVISRFSSNRSASQKSVFLYLNAPAFVVLILNLFQSLLSGHFEPSLTGISAQLFYLSLVNLAGSISIIFRSISVTTVYITAFLLMCGASYLGCFPSDPYK